MASQRRTWPVAGGTGMEGSARKTVPRPPPDRWGLLGQVLSHFGKGESNEQNHHHEMQQGEPH